MLDFSINPVIITLFSVLIVSSIYLLAGFRHYVSTVRRKVVSDTRREDIDSNEYDFPPASVIVYSAEDADNLEILLPQILQQDYPSPFEVIVVNDGDVSATKDVMARLEQSYSNLYMTFTPVDSRAVSRKKLAVTLGVKAAKFGVIVHTTGECQVPSTKWLRNMVRNFEPGIDIVLGYATPAEQDGTKHRWKRLHAFDQVRTAVEWLSWAIAGRPYRGTGYNLAYRRDIFFKNKGFSKSLNLKWGDDDIFVSEVVAKGNTKVELSADSILLHVQDAPVEAHRSEKMRRDFTAKRLRRHARLFFSTCSWAWWLLIGSCAGLSVCGLPSILPMIVSVIVLLTTWIILMVAWRRTSMALWSRPIFLTFPWFMSYHPIYTLYYRIKGWRKRSSNYSWG